MCNSREYLKTCLIKSSEARWRQPDALKALGAYGETIGRSRKHFNPGIERLLDIQNAKEILNLGTPAGKSGMPSISNRLPGLTKALNGLNWQDADKIVPGWNRDIRDENYHLGISPRHREIPSGTIRSPYLHRTTALADPFINSAGRSGAVHASPYTRNVEGYGLGSAARTQVLSVLKPKPNQIYTSDFGIESSEPGFTAKQYRAIKPGSQRYKSPSDLYETLVTPEKNKTVGKFLTRLDRDSGRLKAVPMNKRIGHIADQIARTERQILESERSPNPVMVGTRNSRIILPAVRNVGGNAIKATTRSVGEVTGVSPLIRAIRQIPGQIRYGFPLAAGAARTALTTAAPYATGALRAAGPYGAVLGAGALGWSAGRGIDNLAGKINPPGYKPTEWWGNKLTPLADMYYNIKRRR